MSSKYIISPLLLAWLVKNTPVLSDPLTHFLLQSVTPEYNVKTLSPNNVFLLVYTFHFVFKFYSIASTFKTPCKCKSSKKYDGLKYGDDSQFHFYWFSPKTTLCWRMKYNGLLLKSSLWQITDRGTIKVLSQWLGKRWSSFTRAN